MVDEESFCEADAAKLLRAWLQRAQVAKSGLDLDLFSHLFHVFFFSWPKFSGSEQASLGINCGSRLIPSSFVLSKVILMDSFDFTFCNTIISIHGYNQFIILRVDPLHDFDWSRPQSGKLWNGSVGRDSRGRLHGKCKINFQVVFAKDYLLTGQEQACTRITWLFVRHHAKNGPIHRKMAVDCPPCNHIQSETLFHTGPDQERGMNGPASLLQS